MREVRVRGRGSIALPPDWVDVNVEIEATHPDYNQMMTIFETRMRELLLDLSMINIDQEDLKTQDFTIDTKYSYRNNEQVFKGYTIKQRMVLSFPFQRGRLNQVVQTLASSEGQPNVNLFFTLKDRDEVEMELLKEAVGEGMRKAEALAASSGNRLGEVIKIEEVVTEPFIGQSLPHTYALEKASLDIRPSDLKVTKEVNLVFELIH